MGHCFLGVLFIMLNKVVPTFESVDEKSKRVTTQLKLSLLSFVLFIVLYKAVLTW